MRRESLPGVTPWPAQAGVVGGHGGRPRPASRSTAVKGLDTNLLVSDLTQDEIRQAQKANALIDGAAASGERLAVGGGPV